MVFTARTGNSRHNKFVSKVCTKPTARKKYEESLNTEESQLDWKKNYLTPIRATLSTKLREFQYKILNRILGTGHKLGAGGRAGANMGRATDFNASSKGRAKQFGACHLGGGGGGGSLFFMQSCWGQGVNLEFF